MISSRRRLLSAMHLGGLTFREVCLRTWTKINEHEILTRAAAISFYALAALVPFLALVITLSAWFLLSGTWDTWVTPNVSMYKTHFSPVLDRRVVEKSRDFWSSGSHQCPQNSLCQFSLQRKPNQHRIILWFWTTPAISATP